MKNEEKKQEKVISGSKSLFIFILIVLVASFIFFIIPEIAETDVFTINISKEKEVEEVVLPPLDTEDYDRRMENLANNPPPLPPKTTTDENGNVIVIETSLPDYLWPAKDLPYPNREAILPFHRVIAYYGNLYSRKMGVLGEYDEPEMFSRLQAEVDKWNLVDPETPAIPALHYIAVVAQASAGPDGKYRTRMPFSEIEKIIKMAEKIDALVFLDVQVGFSTIVEELPPLLKYLKMPQVHFGMDPEFSMKGDIRPGKVVGTYDAEDINLAANYLAKIVRENNLPPKILVVHRYTQKMLTNVDLIKPLPEVQIVIHMDGWGEKNKKKGTYQRFVYEEPVQFAGLKLFYKNDLWPPSTGLLTPEELLELRPRPIYIQYQ